MTECDIVAERVALGDPLGDLAEHAASCARCRRLAALPAELGAARSVADPGLGFSARLTAGAQQRIAQRRRRRIAGALASTLAAAAAVMAVVARQPAPGYALDPSLFPRPAVRLSHDPWQDPEPTPAKPTHDVDPDVRTLVHFARYERAPHAHAHWSRIEKPLAPYRMLFVGGEP
ncbi:MAG TPA: hypothetical protein VMJ10_02065 [Kofleriaceae bacterium]|nr:hypothetical protein [Kofleriaceae bacterium]